MEQKESGLSDFIMLSQYLKSKKATAYKNLTFLS